jgi:hypothetical protein
MLGRKTYSPEELEQARRAIGEQLAAYDKVASAVGDDPEAAAALEAFAPLFFNHLLLALDRFFVHRLRAVTGKDGNPLNEVELLADSLMGNGGVLRGNNVIKLVPAESVTQVGYGEPIRLGADQFARLSQAFLAEIEAKFV